MALSSSSSCLQLPSAGITVPPWWCSHLVQLLDWLGLYIRRTNFSFESMYVIFFFFSLHFKIFCPNITSCCLLFWDLACSSLVDMAFFNQKHENHPSPNELSFLGKSGEVEGRRRILGFLTYCFPCSKLYFPITITGLAGLPSDHASISLARKTVL